MGQGRNSHKEIARRVHVSRPTAARRRTVPGHSPSTFGQHRLELITAGRLRRAAAAGLSERCRSRRVQAHEGPFSALDILQAQAGFAVPDWFPTALSDRLGLDILVQPVGLFVPSLMSAAG